MKLQPTQFSRRRGQPGVALVIVVSLIAMLTVVTVTLMVLVDQSNQRSAADASIRQTESLAQAAFETLLADLNDEMSKGSGGVVEERMADGSLYRQYDMSRRRGGMRVTNSLQAGAPANGALVKQSQSQRPFHTWPGAPAPRASSVSTADERSQIPPVLWDRPALLGPQESFQSTSAPNWVYISRDGSNPATFSNELREDRGEGGSPNPSFVIGRYAYNLYDTSGLLDANVAGYPATGGPDARRVGQKGSLVFADLSVLPGMSREAADRLAKWRHSWQGDHQEYIRKSEGSGWQRMMANDNLFLDRQDMLEFARRHPDLLPRETLPYLTHFSRDLDAPSYRPDPTRSRIARNSAAGGNDAYGADDIVNPDLTAYDEARQGALLANRFPLERLKWVATPGADGPPDEDKAERYFGLRWRGTYWEYVHARSNGDLYTLQDVPADREPNFFEILRATVLAGSLGRQYAARGHDALDQQLSMHRLGGVDGSVNLNILEMGACIIDQYDEDNYPTAIMLDGPARPFFAFGKEDVPYLQRMSAIPYRGQVISGARVYYEHETTGAAGPPAPSETYEVNMVLQPMLWRPHQVAETSEGPTRFRIRPQHVDLAGGSQFWMAHGWPVPDRGSRPGIPPRGAAGDYSYWGAPNYRSTHPELFPKTFFGDEFIDVIVPQSSTAFREPQSVHSPAHAAVAGYEIAGNQAPIPVRSGDLRWEGLPTGYDSVSGFLVGLAITARLEGANPPASMRAPNSWGRLGVGYFRGDPIEVMMEYQAPDGSWRPYQRAEFTYKSNWGDHYLRREPLWETEAFHWSSFLIDPRTARFGGIATVLAGGMSTSSWTTLHPQMTWPEGASLAFGRQRSQGVRPGWSGPAANTGWNHNGPISYWEPWNHAAVAENNATAWGDLGAAGGSFAYRDPDEVMRQGVAGHNEYNRSMFLGNPMSRRYQLGSTGQLTAADPLHGRPRVLNRPFRSVAELAYSFRGTPWRDIDFLNANSPDAGLLDVFSLYEDPDEELAGSTRSPRSPRIVAGRVNLNAASPEVLTALLAGTARDEGNVISATEAPVLARALVGSVRSQAATAGPLLSKSELVSRPTGANGNSTGLVATLSDRFQSPEDRSINDRREAVTRGLADGTTVRSWNFMLDLVVQGGRLPASSTGLETFQPAAERRYWVHFAVDRISGRLLDVQWEQVEY